MAKVKVAVIGTVNKVIQFDPDAGDRALAAVEALAQAIDEGVGGTINHSSLRGLQVGDDHPQYAMWQAPETIQGLWDFQTIPLIQGETLAEYIEDVVGSGLFDFIQDTPSIKWTYFDTAAEIEANVDLDWAPVWTNNHRWTDNDEIQLGTGGDLRLYHDGTNSHIRNDTGSLFVVMGDGFSSVEFPQDHSFRLSNILAASVANIATPALYSTSGTGSGDFASAGHLIIQPRSSAARDIVLMAGSTSPVERLRIMGATAQVRMAADNLELQIGAGQDLRLFHDGTNSTIRNDTGSLLFLAGASTAATMSSGAAFTFNNTVTVGTTSDASTVGVGAINVSNPSGSTADFRMLTGGLNRWIFRKTGTGETGSNVGSDFAIISRNDDGSNLANVVLATRATGAWAFSGGAAAHVSLNSDNQELRFGASNDMQIWHDGTNSNIENDTGILRLRKSSTNVVQLDTDYFDMMRSIRRTSVISPAQITANTDNYNPTGLASAATLRLSTDASRNLTGIVAQAAGTEITICNVGAQDLVLVHDATSTAANRFLCPGSANFTLNANDSVRIWYDTTSARWRVIEA